MNKITITSDIQPLFCDGGLPCIGSLLALFAIQILKCLHTKLTNPTQNQISMSDEEAGVFQLLEVPNPDIRLSHSFHT